MTRRPLRGCRFLLASLVLLLLSFPVLEEMARPILLTGVIAGVFLAGVMVVHPGRSRVRKAVALAVMQLGLTGLAVVLRVGSVPYRITVSLALATIAVLIAYSIYCVLRYVLLARYISRDQIYAGMCAYLMLGFAFGCIYYLIAMLEPGCFAVNTARLNASDPDLMYFSFVTLATLGYGDITPVAKAPRALAQLEALAGTLYMAVFMARLVSLAGGGGPPAEAADIVQGLASEHWNQSEQKRQKSPQ
jgi:hypothetical protein